MNYAIVKSADNDSWRSSFIKDPKITGTQVELSVGCSQIGQKLNIPIFYKQPDLAQLDCDRINCYDPNGHYDVCPLQQ